MAEPINPLSLQERDGMAELTKLAVKLCYLINKFETVINAKFGDNIAIMLLIQTIKALCTALPDGLSQWEAITQDATLPPENPDEILGINPSAPADVPPFEIV